MNPSDRKTRRRIRLLIALCLLLPPPVYVAGAGPVVYGVILGRLPRSTVLLYEPLRAVMNRSPWRHEWIAYWHSWAEAADAEADRLGDSPKSFGWEYDVLLP